MAHFPMDIISDLFILLPATTLVRCRVLSKPCFSLIDSPDFVASHLKRNVETGDNLMILLRAPRLLRTVYLDSPGKVSDVDHPLQSCGFTEVFGSVNGLVGLTNSPLDMALFNPSTRKIHRLPIEPVEFPDRLITHKYNSKLTSIPAVVEKKQQQEGKSEEWKPKKSDEGQKPTRGSITSQRSSVQNQDRKKEVFQNVAEGDKEEKAKADCTATMVTMHNRFGSLSMIDEGTDE